KGPFTGPFFFADSSIIQFARSIPEGRALKKAFLVVLLVLVLASISAAVVFHSRLDSDPPQVSRSTQADAIGLAPFDITVTDSGTGLRSVAATISQGSGEQVLANEQFPHPAAEKKITVALAKVPGIKEGPAVLRVTARDASLWRWGRGNEATFEKQFAVDITPPTLELVADDRYINFGGVGA